MITGIAIGIFGTIITEILFAIGVMWWFWPVDLKEEEDEWSC